MLRWFRAGAAATAVLALAYPAAAQIPAELPGARNASAVAAEAERYMVAAANPHAAEAGREILRAGGSAVDAAIAMQLVLSLVEPQSSGVGGGGFLVIYDARTGQVTTIDGRETAPASAGPNLFLGPDGKPIPFAQAFTGGRVVGIPGTIRMMEMAHKKAGKLPWARLFQPAIRLARQGFAVSTRLHAMLVNAEAIARDFPAMRAVYYDKDGKALPVGTMLKDPAYAKLLSQVAKKGADAYYRGKPAKRAVEAITTAPKAPVKVTAEDFANYKAIERPPVCQTYRTYKICGMGPPSSGLTTILATLKMLERFDIKALGPNSPQAIHLIAESMALAYADRELYLADPAYVDVPTAGLLDDDYLKQRSELINPEKATGSYAPGTPPRQEKTALAPHEGPQIPSTSHWAAVDAEGNAASWTGSIQAPFGSFLYVDGYLLNNELTDFSFVPEKDGKPVVNRTEPGKRPRSSMSPALVFDGKGRLVMAVGSAGGSRIITHVLKTLIATLDWGMDVQQAINYPNFYKGGDTLEIEAGSSLEAMRAALEAKGHKVVARAAVSGLHGIQVKYDASGKPQYLGGADPRREGVALGD